MGTIMQSYDERGTGSWGVALRAVLMLCAAASLLAYPASKAFAGPMEPITACIDCHGSDPEAGEPPVESATRNNPVRAIIGSHTTHMSAPYAGDLSCSDCHVMPGVGVYDHRNGSIDMNAGGILGGAYSVGVSVPQDNEDGTGLGNCTNTACHGSASSNWATDLSSLGQCYKCHGNAGNGNAAPETNAHQTHLQSLNNYSSDVSCGSCHTVPGSVDMTGADNHLDFTSGGNADVAGSFTYTPGTMECSAATCHGNGLANGSDPTPLWDNATYLVGTSSDCGVCHGNPPTGAAGYNHNGISSGPGTCYNNASSCHPHEGTGSPAEHIDGTTDAIAATSCDGCHANPPLTGAHDLHTTVTSQTTGEDRTDCAQCHTGADTYDYSSGGLHQNSTVDVAAGWNGTNCTSACHTSTPADGFWTDTALNCDACHAQPPTSGKHSQHWAAATITDCTDCHTMPGAGDTAHITDRSGANEGAVLAGMAAALSDEAEVIASTWNDTANTCATAQCHNPSGGAYSADWDTDTASCTLCHSDTDPGTGSHTEHLSASGTFGIDTIGCTSCHVDNTGVTDHMDRGVDYAGGISYAANSCTTTSCHNDGTGTPVASPAWGTPSADCNICHTEPPTTGSHTVHWASTYVTACGNCHLSETATTHINGTPNTSSGYNSVDGTCSAASCHANTAGADWRDGSPVPDCADCHTAGYIGYMPASGLHNNATAGVTDHNQTLSGSCQGCHTSSPTTPSGDHRNGTLNNPSTTTFNYDLTGKTINLNNLADNTDNTCTATCHTDGGDWTRLWSTDADSTATAVGSARCNVCHGQYTNGWNAGVGHDANPTRGQSGHAGDCETCHSYLYAGYANHDNGSITMNSNGTSHTRSAGVAWCAGCHTNDGTHTFSIADAFTPDYVAGPAISGSCDQCHEYDTTGTTWSSSAKADQDGIGEGKGDHDKHIINIKAEKGVTLTANGDQFGTGAAASVCGVCHTNTSGNHSTGGDVTGRQVNFGDGSTANSYDTGGAPVYNGTPGTPSATDPKDCSNVNCHFGSTPEWGP